MENNSSIAEEEIWLLQMESSTDGFETFFRDEKYPILVSNGIKIMNLYWILSKIDEFENPTLKIDGLQALSVYKKHLYKKQLVEFMKNKKQGLVMF